MKDSGKYPPHSPIFSDLIYLLKSEALIDVHRLGKNVLNSFWYFVTSNGQYRDFAFILWFVTVTFQIQVIIKRDWSRLLNMDIMGGSPGDVSKEPVT